MPLFNVPPKPPKNPIQCHTALPERSDPHEEAMSPCSNQHPPTSWGSHQKKGQSHRVEVSTYNFCFFFVDLYTPFKLLWAQDSVRISGLGENVSQVLCLPCFKTIYFRTFLHFAKLLPSWFFGVKIWWMTNPSHMLMGKRYIYIPIITYPYIYIYTRMYIKGGKKSGHFVGVGSLNSQYRILP